MAKRFFRNTVVDEPAFFDEGPVIQNNSPTGLLTSSISTVDVDAYRQGIELTTQKHCTAGFVKIYSGEPGHSLLKSNFGWDDDFSNDVQYHDPLNLSEIDYDKGFTMNGAIEPLTIRNVASFKINIHDVVNSIKGMVQSGNERLQVSETIDESRDTLETIEFVPYLDSYVSNYFENTNGTSNFGIDARESLNAFTSSMKSFNDVPELAIDNVYNDTTLTSYVALSSSSLSRTRYNVASYVFNDSPQGTDSIAFGGMRYY